jgi:Na+-transporting NADH:ubiquinone oxidoreductase subunit NqrB
MQQLKIFFQDPRNYQIVFLFSFLCYGILHLDWDAEYNKYIALFATCTITQLIGNYLWKLPNKNLKSVIITALGLSLLLKTEYWYIAVLAGFLAILGKFIFRTNHSHFVNPANFGLIATILITQKAWVSPGQWGSEALLFFGVGTLGFIVSSKAKSLDIALSFLITLFCLQFIRTVLYLNWPMDHLWQQFSSGSLLLFTFFMITDPVSAPSNAICRRLWAITIAMVSFYFINFKFLPTAPIYTLFVFAFATPILNIIAHYAYHRELQPKQLRTKIRNNT